MDTPLFIGKNMVILNEVDSTNTHLTKLLHEEELYEGTVVAADHQISGRGQHENKWESEVGKNILLSVLVYPKFLSARKNFLLNITFSMALKDFFYGIMPDCEIKVKWPNDIYCNNRKIAGLLIENIIRGEKISQTIAGIGINVNQQEFRYAPNATSVSLEAEKEFKREKLMLQLFKAIEKRYMQLRSGNYNRMAFEYQESLFKKDIASRYKNADNEEFEGVIRGVDEEGRLIIERGSEINKFRFKEITFL